MTNEKPTQRWRWFVAGWLRRASCWVMREKWYVADAWHGVPGNRAAELKQQIWVQTTFIASRASRISQSSTAQELGEIEPALDELAQIAGEAWGHVWPKEKPL